MTLWDISNIASGGRKSPEPLTLKGAFTAVAFTPDGRCVASNSGDNTAKVWNAETGQEVHTLGGHTNEVTSVAFSPDAKRLATGSDDKTVKLWDAETGHELRTLKGHTSAVTKLAFSPDARRLASASRDNTVKVWDAERGEERLTLKGHGDAVWSVVFSPDGRRLASGSWDQSVKVWDAESGHELRTLEGDERVAFSPDGWRLVSRGSTVKVWDARPLTPEVSAEQEAIGLVEFLFDKPLLKGDVIEEIRSNKTSSEKVRKEALAFAELFREEKDPKRYAEASRWLTRQRYLAARWYQQALRQAEGARQLAAEKDKGLYLDTLAMAQYRVGKYKEAVASLMESEKSQGNAKGTAVRDSGRARRLAFLAMAHFQLGQKEKGKETLEKLREVMKKPEAAKDEEAQGFLREAEELVEGKPAEGPKK